MFKPDTLLECGCVCLCVCAYVCIYMGIYACIYVCMHTCMHLCSVNGEMRERGVVLFVKNFPS